jgi:hypothetical protein
MIESQMAIAVASILYKLKVFSRSGFCHVYIRNPFPDSLSLPHISLALNGSHAFDMTEMQKVETNS